jgi:hypothetical protein
VTALHPRPFFFQADGDALIPQPNARGPWGQTLHGRIFGALVARAVEQHRADDPGLICTRLTVDMFRAAGMSPVQVSYRPIRQGRRITVLEVTIEQQDGPVGQGKAVLLRGGEQPTGQFRATPRWDVPTPEQMGPSSARSRADREPMWESWVIGGHDVGVSGLGEGLWMRETHDLVGGEALTPLVCAAAAGDVAHPVGNATSEGLAFINADYTVYLGREPRGAYVGIQPYGHISADGVAVAQCIVHDVEGPVGFVATTAVANSMARSNQRT